MGPFLPPTGGIAQRMFAGRRPASSNEAYWRDKLANQGVIKKDNAPLVQKLQGKVASGLRAAGMDKHNANRLASKTLAALNDLTPVGNATMASDGAQQARRGYQKGSVWDAVAGGAQVGLAALPGAVSRPAKGLFGKGIRAWHGSPHDFDKFSLSKIGTGEGAQAYGHGLYFAENKDVAAQYRDALATPKLDGQKLSGGQQYAHERMRKHGGDIDAAIAEMQQMQQQSPAMGDFYSQVAQELQGFKGKQFDPQGRLYEVNINAKPDELLDWDAPINRQPMPVRSALADILGDRKLAEPNDYVDLGIADFTKIGGGAPPVDPRTGEKVYRSLGEQLAASGALKEAGLPGLRYYDQGSRHGKGPGTRNYVIFDDRLIDILNKY